MAASTLSVVLKGGYPILDCHFLQQASKMGGEGGKTWAQK